MNPTPEDGPIERLDGDAFVASLPGQLGYRPSPGTVVVSAFDAGHRSQWTAALEVPTGPDRAALLRDVAQQLNAAQREHSTAMIVLTGYGPEGDTAAQDVRQALADGPTHVFYLAHVDGPLDGQQVRTLAHDELHWSGPRTLPDTAARTVLQGRAQPAADRAAFSARYAPLSSPTFQAMPTAAARDLDGTRPSLRADVAVRYLDQLAAARGADPGKAATIAHLVNGDLVSRDTVLAAAAADRARTAALVDVYRGAPAELRPACATSAAAALFMQGAPQSAVTPVLTHADRTGRHAQLTRLVETASHLGLNGPELRAAVTADFSADLQAADERWAAAAAVRDVRSAAFPGTATGATAGTGTGQARTARPANTRPHRGSGEVER